MAESRRRLRSAAGATGRVVFGDERRIGLWIAPLMAIVALVAAVLAAGITILVYAQRVDDLREEVGGAAAAADAATQEIEDLVDTFALELGVAQASEDDEEVAPTDRGPNAAGVFAISTAGGSVGNAFTFFSDDAQTFLISSASVVGSASSVQVFLPGGTTSGTVLGVDTTFDLATIRIDVGSIAPLRWRSPADPLQPGTRGRLLGVAGPDTPAQPSLTVVGVASRALLVDVGLTTALRGSPLLDATGGVIGVASASYAPFGPATGTLLYMPPIRAVCVTLVACAPEDLGGAGPFDDAPTPVPAPLAAAAQPAQPPPPPAAPPPAAPVATTPPQIPQSTPSPSPSQPAPTGQPTEGAPPAPPTSSSPPPTPGPG